jgi:uncharacterized membrane protein YphA (DoxX/SURF4 family)
MSYDTPSSPSFGLVLVRITTGAILAIAGWSKLSEGVSPELVLGTREAFVAAPSVIRAWGENVVLPHPSLFAHLIAWGELVGGLALFLGLLTRPVGVATAFMMANFYFVGPESARSLVLLLGVAALGCSISRAGQSAGADVFLVERLPPWLTWTRAA